MSVSAAVQLAVGTNRRRKDKLLVHFLLRLVEIVLGYSLASFGGRQGRDECWYSLKRNLHSHAARSGRWRQWTTKAVTAKRRSCCADPT